jgi:hypothetical protein
MDNEQRTTNTAARQHVSLVSMLTRREVALRLDIPLEMARRHDIPPWLSESDLSNLEEHPPAWLVQSRANRTGKRPVWVELTCDVCGFTESARPKKWWPHFTYLTCDHHWLGDLPDAVAGSRRTEYDGIGSRFIGIVDEPVDS